MLFVESVVPLLSACSTSFFDNVGITEASNFVPGPYSCTRIHWSSKHEVVEEGVILIHAGISNIHESYSFSHMYSHRIWTRTTRRIKKEALTSTVFKSNTRPIGLHHASNVLFCLKFLVSVLLFSLRSGLWVPQTHPVLFQRLPPSVLPPREYERSPSIGFAGDTYFSPVCIGCNASLHSSWKAERTLTSTRIAKFITNFVGKRITDYCLVDHSLTPSV